MSSVLCHHRAAPVELPDQAGRYSLVDCLYVLDIAVSYAGERVDFGDIVIAIRRVAVFGSQEQAVEPGQRIFGAAANEPAIVAAPSGIGESDRRAVEGAEFASL